MPKLKLKEAASNLLRWNLKGQATGARPRRGIYLRRRDETSLKNCFACKVGLVMLGRWGEGAFYKHTRYQDNVRKRIQVQNYGPDLYCPTECFELGKGNFANRKLPLGRLIEHLFETHKWSVMRIDKWLAEQANLDLERERKKVGLADAA